eukprot:SAG31_NODE_338_length_17490_cov_7.707032_1_plen_646_part_10
MNCQEDLNSVLVASLLADCFKHDSLIVRQGYKPLLQCAREVAASCSAFDCLNLYYDVHDHCVAAIDGCGYPVNSGPSATCQNALALMRGHDSTCTGMYGFPRQLGNARSNISFSDFASGVEALCFGCDIATIKEACPDASECSPSCARFAIPFYENFVHNLCQERWNGIGMQADILFVQNVHDTCSRPCNHPPVTAPPYGNMGTCPLDGHMEYGNCSLQCNEGFNRHGRDPSCVAGQLTPSTVTCRCPDGFWTNGQECAPCTRCDEVSEVAVRCGYTSNGDYTGTSNTQCRTCPHGLYKSPATDHCTECRVCTESNTAQACLPNRDTLCAESCALPDLHHLDRGNCPLVLSEGATCELQCRQADAHLSGFHNGQENLPEDVQPRCSGGQLYVHMTESFLEIDRWSPEKLVCSVCSDNDEAISSSAFSSMGMETCQEAVDRFLSMGSDCDDERINLSSYGFPQGYVLRDVCPLSCEDCNAPLPTPAVDCEGAWGRWTICSQPCGGGVQTRVYTVSQVADGGSGCDFDDGTTEEEHCNMDPCAVDCDGSWGEWGDCTGGAVCGGFQFRSYSVTQMSEYGGAECPVANEHTDRQPCEPCAVACEGSWDSWSPCTAECGGGTQHKQFRVSQPAVNGGTECEFRDQHYEER